MYELLITITFLLNPATRLEIAHQHTINGDHVAALKILNGVNVNEVDINTYYFCKLVSEFASNDKLAAQRTVYYFDSGLATNVPIRYDRIAYLISEDLKNWKSDDLADIGRDMQFSRNRLNKGDAGKNTQKIQAEILRKLDKQIQDLQKEADKMQAADAAKAGKRMPGQDLPDTPSQPQADSEIGKERGEGRVNNSTFDPKTILRLGTLPEIEREKQMNRRINELPVEKRKMIQDYYRKVAEETVNDAKRR